MHCSCNFAIWSMKAKLACISFFLLYDFTDRKFILTVDLSIHSLWFVLIVACGIWDLSSQIRDQNLALWGRSAVLTREVPTAYDFIKLRTCTFSLQGSTLWLLFGRSELPASLLLCFPAIIEPSKGHLNTRMAISGQLIW